MFLNENDFDDIGKLQLIKKFLDQYPCLYGIKDLNSRFMVANETMAQLTGYACANEVMERRICTEEFRCETAYLAEHVYAEDANVISQKQQAMFIGYTRFATNEKQIVYGTKTPILDSNNQVIAIIDQFMDISHNPFFNLSAIISSLGKNIFQSDNQFSYQITNKIQKIDISAYYRPS